MYSLKKSPKKPIKGGKLQNITGYFREEDAAVSPCWCFITLLLD